MRAARDACARVVRARYARVCMRGAPCFHFRYDETIFLFRFFRYAIIIDAIFLMPYYFDADYC
jgi:hypothetical protein